MGYEILYACVWVMVGCVIGYLTRSANLRIRFGFDEPYHSGDVAPYTHIERKLYKIPKLHELILSAGRYRFPRSNTYKWSVWVTFLAVYVELQRRG